MTRRSTYLCLALRGGLLLLVLLSPQHSLPRQLLLGESSLQESGSSLKEDGPPSKTARTLRKTDPSIEETARLLHTTILAELEIEHLSLKRTVGHLNQLIQDAGVDQEELQLQLNHQNGNIATTQVKGLRLMNSSLASILTEIGDQTATTLQVTPHLVELVGSDDPDAMTERKLDDIIVPKLDLEDTGLEEAIDFLRQCIREIDPAKEPEQKGFSVVLRKPRLEEPADSAIDPNRPTHTQTLTFQVEHISVAEALDRITAQTGMRWTIDQHAIKIVPLPYQEDPRSHPP